MTAESVIAKTTIEMARKVIELVVAVEFDKGEVTWKVQEKRDYALVGHPIIFKSSHESARNCYITTIETELISDDRPEE